MKNAAPMLTALARKYGPLEQRLISRSTRSRTVIPNQKTSTASGSTAEINDCSNGYRRLPATDRLRLERRAHLQLSLHLVTVEQREAASLADSLVPLLSIHRGHHRG